MRTISMSAALATILLPAPAPAAEPAGEARERDIWVGPAASPAHRYPTRVFEALSVGSPVAR